MFSVTPSSFCGSFFSREDYSFTAYATISYLKVGPRACLLSNEAHAVTMQVKKSAQSSVRVTGYSFSVCACFSVVLY